MRLFAYILFISTYFISCKKAEERNCLKTTGKLDSLDIYTDGFHELNLGKRLNYNLVSDSINFVRIKGGKNLIRLVKTEVIDGILYIEDKNRCNFLRDLGKILEIEIHYTHLNRIDGRISHNLKTRDTIFGDYFNLRISGASGNAHILVNTDFINGFSNDGNSDYYFYGKTKFAHIQAHSIGFADVRQLIVSEKLEITSTSIRDIYCRADGIPLIVNLSSTGNVYYKGTPTEITLNKTGSGNLIKLD
jgi:hypothetical protein